jgi:ubiquinone/menaquinone biosynthesis C-methylase UbiE
VSWEQEAANWIAWTRNDAYWDYRDAFFALVPEPGAATLEVGCGEGRVARDLAARGHAITAIDASPTLLEAAAEAHPEGRYLVADAGRLPFEDGSFEIVVAYNVLMALQDMSAAIDEAARVLTPDGRLCVCVVHPWTDGGRRPEQYLTPRLVEDTVERDGMQITFHGWAHPLEAYVRALEGAGLAIEALREPRGTGDWQENPMFLMWRARR